MPKKKVKSKAKIFYPIEIWLKKDEDVEIIASFEKARRNKVTGRQWLLSLYNNKPNEK